MHLRVCEPVLTMRLAPLQLLDVVRALKPACTRPEGFSVEALHAKLQAAGYIVELKHNGECAARSVGRRCLENLHHTYIVCRGSLADAVTVCTSSTWTGALLLTACTGARNHESAKCLLHGKSAQHVQNVPRLARRRRLAPSPLDSASARGSSGSQWLLSCCCYICKAPLPCFFASCLRHMLFYCSN